LPALSGLHDLRTRTSGTHDFVQFHVWVDPHMTVLEAHDIIDAAEDALIARFPGTEILIHLDPEGQVDKEGILPTELAEHAPL
jgi:ferrous-iron efflux pump FieF